MTILLSTLRNPVFTSSDNLRDPAVLPLPDGRYSLFFSRYSNERWDRPENWSVARVFTRDFLTFEGDADLVPKGFASPGDPIQWRGRWLLPYQSYPVHPSRLFYSASEDGLAWSAPISFLAEVNSLPWNTRGRAIDPSFVVDGDTLHCFFVGSCWQPDADSLPANAIRHANLVGQAITRDPDLKEWEIITPTTPLLGITPEAPDGSENVMVFRTGELWTMIYSEGLAEQHLALAQSPDLRRWQRLGRLDLPVQSWMASRYGAPFVWRELPLPLRARQGRGSAKRGLPDGSAKRGPEGWWMILMGEDHAHRTTLGLLTSSDGLNWDLLPER